MSQHSYFFEILSPSFLTKIKTYFVIPHTHPFSLLLNVNNCLNHGLLTHQTNFVGRPNGKLGEMVERGSSKARKECRRALLMTLERMNWFVLKPNDGIKIRIFMPTFLYLTAHLNTKQVRLLRSNFLAY